MAKRNELLAQARSPAALIALAALIGISVLFFFLGKWQWDRTQDILIAERAAADSPVDIAEVFTGSELDSADLGRSVLAVGRFNADNQSRVTNRLSSGDPDATQGDWIASEFVDSSGLRIAVVRGWVPPGAEFATPIDDIAIRGVVHPNEAFYTGSTFSDNELVVIDSEVLAAAWGVELEEGFLILQEQVPLGGGDPLVVPPTIDTADVAFPLQNFFYAVQWWIFAGFAVIIYLRWLIVAARDDKEPAG